MPPRPTPPLEHKLTLSTTSLHNLVIASDSDHLYYEVVTPRWERGSTVISKLDPDSREFEVVAETQNEARTRRPMSVRLRGEEFRPVSEFLVKDEEDKEHRVNGRFRGKDGRMYIWRVNRGRLELIQEDAGADAKPVAFYGTHRRYFLVLRMSRRPSLTVEPSILETLDSVILSFLLIQRQRKQGSAGLL